MALRRFILASTLIFIVEYLLWPLNGVSLLVFVIAVIYLFLFLVLAYFFSASLVCSYSTDFLDLQFFFSAASFEDAAKSQASSRSFITNLHRRSHLRTTGSHV